jgi:non-specific serine/threonine protein kinase
LSAPREEALEWIAQAITDGNEVDWKKLRETHPDLRREIDQLRKLQGLSATFRTPWTHGDLGLGVEGPAASIEREGVATEPVLFRWGPLHVIEKIGEGSFGEVYRAYDSVLQREAALKLRRTPAGREESGFVAYLEEARRLARVRHPNVLSIQRVETHEGRAGLWTDFLRGTTLEQVIEEESPIEGPEIRRIAVDLCRATAAVHAAGVLHGDIKASNVMREPDGRIVLMDFGAGSILQRSAASGDLSARAGSHALVGTPLVMAPELFEGAQASPATDLYSLGVLIYRLATGRYPVLAATTDELREKHRLGTRVPLAELRPDLPAAFVQAIERALAPSGRRYGSAAEMETVLSVTFGGTPAAEDARQAATGPNNLPFVATRFVGRDAELAEIHRIVLAHRAVTLSGHGGAGKTRLALRAAEQLLGAFPDGAWLIALAPVSSEREVPYEAARSLRVPEPKAGTIEDALVEGISERALLIVLDNCEHLREACAALVGRILDGCPNARFLATSREPLGIPGERVWPVLPLALPPGAEGAEGLEIADYEAVRLFLDRAFLSRPSFSLTRENAPTIARICRRLDGIPLAIELAAARVKALGTEEIASRLEESLRILSGGGAVTSSHHETIEASIAWSYDLLTESERTLLARLSIFAGGWTIVGAERICEDGAEAVPSQVHAIGGAEILDLLQSLVEKSLVVFDASSPDSGSAAPGRDRTAEPRYRMLEIMRQFARRKLAAPELDRLHRRHLDAFLALAEELGPQLLLGQSGPQWLRIASDHDNFRAALEWAQGAGGGEIEKGLRVATILRSFWIRAGYLHEGRSRLTGLLDSGRGSDAARAGALYAAATIASIQADYESARTLGEQALAIQRRLGDKPGIASTLAALAIGAVDQADYESGRTMIAESIALARELGQKTAVGYRLNTLGTLVARLGDPAAGRVHFLEALETLREIGDARGLATTLGNLSMNARQIGDNAKAREYSEEEIAIIRAHGSEYELGVALRTRAHLLLLARDFAATRETLLESMRVSQKYGVRSAVLWCLEIFVVLEQESGNPARAARILGGVSELREKLKIPCPPADRESRDEVKAKLREQLGEAAFASAWAAGKVSSIEEITAFVEQGL